jgi:hypothetical protein
MANEPAPTPNYGANSTYSTGANPSGYDPARADSPGRGYGVDPNMTAQTPQSSEGTSSQPPEQSRYGQYAQNQMPPAQTSPPTQQQRFEQYGSHSGYGSSTGAEPESAWSQNSGYGAQDQPGAGTVAAQPAPAYQNQYTPNGANSQTVNRQTTNGYGPPRPRVGNVP